MKLVSLTLSVMFSLSSFAAIERLSYNEPELEVNQVALVKPIQLNLIRLYQKLPSERRMIAGFRETKIKEIPKTSMYLDDLREKLKSTNGKIRL